MIGAFPGPPPSRPSSPAPHSGSQPATPAHTITWQIQDGGHLHEVQLYFQSGSQPATPAHNHVTDSRWRPSAWEISCISRAAASQQHLNTQSRDRFKMACICMTSSIFYMWHVTYSRWLPYYYQLFLAQVTAIKDITWRPYCNPMSWGFFIHTWRPSAGNNWLKQGDLLSAGEVVPIPVCTSLRWTCPRTVCRRGRCCGMSWCSSGTGAAPCPTHTGQDWGQQGYLADDLTVKESKLIFGQSRNSHKAFCSRQNTNLICIFHQPEPYPPTVRASGALSTNS